MQCHLYPRTALLQQAWFIKTFDLTVIQALDWSFGDVRLSPPCLENQPGWWLLKNFGLIPHWAYTWPPLPTRWQLDNAPAMCSPNTQQLRHQFLMFFHILRAGKRCLCGRCCQKQLVHVGAEKHPQIPSKKTKIGIWPHALFLGPIFQQPVRFEMRGTRFEWRHLSRPSLQRMMCRYLGGHTTRRSGCRTEVCRHCQVRIWRSFQMLLAASKSSKDPC